MLLLPLFPHVVGRVARAGVPVTQAAMGEGGAGSSDTAPGDPASPPLPPDLKAGGGEVGLAMLLGRDPLRGCSGQLCPWGCHGVGGSRVSPSPALPRVRGLPETRRAWGPWLCRQQPAPAVGGRTLSARAGLGWTAQPLPPKRRPGTVSLRCSQPRRRRRTARTCRRQRPTAGRSALRGTRRRGALGWFLLAMAGMAPGAASLGCWAGRGVTVPSPSAAGRGRRWLFLPVVQCPFLGGWGRAGLSLGTAARRGGRARGSSCSRLRR